MKQIAWVFAAVFVLNGCGGDGRPTEPDLASAQDVDESRYAADDDWGDEYVEDGGLEDDPELGVLRINLAGEQHETQGYCSLQMTRMQRGEIATVHANLSVRSFDDQPGADSESGELNINWGTDPDNGMVPMGINYEPPASPDIDVYDLGWVQDVESTKTASLAITVDGEPRTISFSDRCDGGYGVEFASANFYRYHMRVRDCAGGWQGDDEMLYLIEEDGELAVDPSAPPGLGRAEWIALGRIGFGVAELSYGRLTPGSADGNRRVGWFRGMESSPGGGVIYYPGVYGYTVEDGGCRASYYHDRDDPGFEPAILQPCDGPCMP